MAEPSRKEETHARIVRTAARAIRERGYAGVGVAEVMKDTGLTHGGFYAHFGSKTAMLAEAASRAGAEGVAALADIAAQAPHHQGLAAIVDAYLSQQHVDQPGTGCPVAALGSEIPRQDAEVRAAATARIKDLVALFEGLMPGHDAERHAEALATLSMLVGALVLARAVDDQALSRLVRLAARMALRKPLTH